MVEHWIINPSKTKFKNQFGNTYPIWEVDISNSVLMLQKGIYPYEYKDDWEQFKQNIINWKKESYSRLNMEDISDADCKHTKGS